MYNNGQWISKYRRIAKIGSGTYGSVYKAENMETKAIVAIKKIYIDEDDEGLPSTAIREIGILKSMDHKNIVKLNETIYFNENLYLVFEFFDGDLKKYFNKYRHKICSNEIKHYLHQMLSAIEYCHAHRIYHRDLKPQNILIKEATKQIQLADFGLSRTITLPNKTWTHEVITLWYRSPEILLGKHRYGSSPDMWSIGCIFGEFCNQSVPLFRGDSEICQLMYIFKNLGTPSIKHNSLHDLPYFKQNAHLFPKWKAKPFRLMVPNLNYLGQDLIKRLLNLDPNERISAKQALRHPYFFK
eukprot:274776_1